jgi:S1-C subfamily serine protease
MCYEARIDGQKGILVDETTPGTPAAKGLKAGDFIIAANGKLVGRLHELTRILYATGVGNEVKLTVIRGARELIIPIRLYDRLTE